MKDGIDVAIVGATGAVGQVLLETLSESRLPIRELYLLASKKSHGKPLVYKDKNYYVSVLDEFDFKKAELVFFVSDKNISKKFVKKATSNGCWVIDNSSCFRYDPEVPLVVPEINPDTISLIKNKRIVANPNCSTIQMLLPLHRIHQSYGIKNINVCTYQAVSGAGQHGINELSQQTRCVIDGAEIVDKKIFNKQIAFNVIPFIDSLESNGYSREEMKMVWETQKIFSDDDLQVNSTAVRVPVIHCHSEAVQIKTGKKINREQALELLKNQDGIVCTENDNIASYHTPIDLPKNTNNVYVSRVRQELNNPYGMNFWIVGNNLRKGAATNAVQIAELLIKKIV